MTQKEYKEELEKHIIEKEYLKDENVKLQSKLNNYEQVLEQNYILNKDLRREQDFNAQNIEKIRGLEKIIEKYENILNKFTFNG